MHLASTSPANLSANTEKVWFAHMLRGFAALSVMATHYVGVFSANTKVIATLAHTEPMVPQPDLLALTVLYWLGTWWLNPAQLGVAVFFLISGFVIPFSLERSGAGQYLIRRVFRIYPPYVTGLMLVILSVYLYGRTTGRPFPYTFSDFMSNASLLRDWLWVPSIDGINWTLEIELKFYVLCAVIAWCSSVRSVSTLAFIGLLSMAFSLLTGGSYEYLLQNRPYVYRVTFVVSYAATFIPFMLIGTCFFNLYQAHWRWTRFLLMAAFLSVCFVTNTYHGATRVMGLQQVVSYGAALVLFTAAFVWRERLRYTRLLDFVADISYPVYITHGVIGYVLITVIHDFVSNAYVVLTITSVLVIGLASVLHRAVELPANALGRRVARSFGKPTTAPGGVAGGVPIPLDLDMSEPSAPAGSLVVTRPRQGT